jgi:hypothetical protein
VRDALTVGTGSDDGDEGRHRKAGKKQVATRGLMMTASLGRACTCTSTHSQAFSLYSTKRCVVLGGCLSLVTPRSLSCIFCSGHWPSAWVWRWFKQDHRAANVWSGAGNAAKVPSLGLSPVCLLDGNLFHSISIVPRLHVDVDIISFSSHGQIRRSSSRRQRSPSPSGLLAAVTSPRRHQP